MRPFAKLLCAAAIAIVGALWLAAAAQADFGIKSLRVGAFNRDGSVGLRAGSHPYQWTIDLTLNQDAEGKPEGTLRDLIVDLPAGMVGDPQALPRCSGADFEGQEAHCPGNTQIGVVRVTNRLTGMPAIPPVYNLTPPLGVAASIGFSVASQNSFQEAALRPEDYGVRVSDLTVPTENIEIQAISETIWGVPAEPGHDPERQCIKEKANEKGELEIVKGCSSELPRSSFLTLPTRCDGPLQFTVRADSVEEPGVFVTKTVDLLGESGAPEALSGCDRPPFQPTISSQPETASADSPTGLDFAIHLPQATVPSQGDPNGTATATAHLKDAVVTLPAGLAVNPSTADGLSACSEAQIGYEGMRGGRPAFSAAPPTCPASSRVATVEVKTPLLDHTLSGAVYIARQVENPFASLLAIYIVIDDPLSGVRIKLAGQVEPDPLTGQLRTVVRQNPQLPFEDFSFHFTGGPRGTLTTPTTCGTYTTATEMVPWTSPEGATAFPSSSFAISSAPGGGPCAGSEAQMPNSPGFEAGTTMPLAGTYAPFVLKLTRENGSQRLRGLNLDMPPGLSGKLAGLAECSDAQIGAAEARRNLGEGAAEKASPSCPPGSELGVVNVGAGSGSPLYVQGHAYLAGPYKGAPLSLVIITPAVAGPFDLGVVVVRAALFVDEFTAQISVKSDPIPTILHGIPLDVRSIAVKIDRPDFTLNPTSCEAMSLSGEAISPTGNVAPLRNRFQVGGCGGLGFKPRLKLRLKGGTKRNGHPALRAVVTYPKGGGYANIARAQVGLPHSEFLDQGNLDKVCRQADLRAGTCPKRSIYGHAKAWTPLLDKPLEGPVYLGVGFGYKLPALVADLNGQVRILLKGKVDTTKHEGIRNTFEAVPDAPVSRFVLSMKGGKRYGLLVNSENVCRKTQRASARFIAHNGKVAQLHPRIRNSCKTKRRSRANHRRGPVHRGVDHRRAGQ